MISIDVEEWYHSKWFDLEKMGFTASDFPSDLPHMIDKLITLFDNYSIPATFFTLIESLNNHPHILDKIINTHHEIGLHGVEHKGITSLGEEEFKKQIRYGKQKLDQLTKFEIIGYRAPNQEISEEAFEILSDENFRYDSSIVPCHKIPGWYGSPESPLHPYIYPSSSESLKKEPFIEFPIAVFPQLKLPGGGGWYLRNVGYNWVKLTLDRLLDKEKFAVFYLHPWEISDRNPNISGIPFHVFRHTGEWCFNALESLIKHFERKASIKTFKQCIEEGLIHG